MITNKIKQIWELAQAITDWMLCKIGDHDWTCALEEGQDKPTQKQVDDGLEGFYDYAKMYCKRCKVVSRLSLRP